MRIYLLIIISHPETESTMKVDSQSDFSDTESSVQDMIEIEDGNVTWLFDKDKTISLTSDVSSNQVWKPFTLEEESE